MGTAAERRRSDLLDRLRGAGAPVSSRELALALGVSPRTVRGDIAAINAAARRRVIGSSQDGYTLDPRGYREFRAGRTRIPVRTVSPQQRLDSVIRTLATSDSVSLFDLAASLNVSESSLEADLVKARAILRDHDLVLGRRGDVLRVTGPESRRRRLIRSLLFTDDLNPAVNALEAVRDQPGGVLSQLHGALTHTLARHGIQLGPYVLGDVLVHLFVSLERERQSGPSAEAAASEAGRTGSHTAGEDAAGEALAAIARLTGVRLPDVERITLAQILAASGTDVGHGDPDTAVSSMTRAITARALSDIEAAFGLTWSDPSARTALELHTQRLLERARTGRQLEQTLGYELRRTLPVVHELTLMYTRRLTRESGFPVASGEVELLAFHLGTEYHRQLDLGQQVTITLFSPGAETAADRTVRELSAALGDAAVILDVILDPARSVTASTADLIVATVPMRVASTVPIVEISPIVTETDVRRVRAAVEEERMLQQRRRARALLIRLLDPALFLRFDRLGGAAEVITAGATALEEHGYVDSDFARDVLERESQSPTAFPGGFAIPHSLYQDARRSGICVVITTAPTGWGATLVQVTLLFAIAPDGAAVFREALGLLIEVLSDPGQVRQLATSETFEALTHTILSLLD